MLTSALKTLRRSPLLALAAVLCLALGAAATSAVSTLVGSLLLRPLPFPHSERLVRVWLESPDGDRNVSLSIPEFDDFDDARAFDAFLGTARVRVVALFGSGAERLRGEGVSRRYFEVLGITATLGRVLNDSDHAPSSAAALVLSYGAWERFFGSDPTVVGRQLRTARAVYTIVGVAQRGFDGTVEDDIVEFFVPVEHYEPRSMQTNRNARSAWAIARLAPGVTLAHAQQEIAAIGVSLAHGHPDVYGRMTARIEPMGESWRGRVRNGSTLLFIAAALLLLIAAINVGCLLLARVLERRRELAVRASLGASSTTLMLQLSVEASLLVFAGGILGAFAGPSVLEAFLALSPVVLPHYVELAPDAWTTSIAVATLAVAGLLAGTVPAVVGRHVQPVDVLREGARGTLGRRTERRWTALLIAGETALTLMLLVAAGLLFRSFDQLDAADLGFQRSNIARLAVTLNAADFGTPAQLPAMYDRLRMEIAQQPAVQAVGLVSPTLPPWDGERGRVTIEGFEITDEARGVDVGVHFADEGLLPLLGARMLSGRGITAADTVTAAPIAVINAALAERLGGPERALGRVLRFAPLQERSSDRAYRIVGVTDNIAYDGLVQQETRQYLAAGTNLRASRYDVYFSLAQTPSPVVSIGVLTSADAAAMIAPVRQAIGRVAPASAVHWTSAMDDEVALEYAPSRFYSVIVVAFSGAALLLTSIGLFALLSHAATQRISEMGLRLALGASPRSTASLLLRTAMSPLLTGIAVGLVGAALIARGMQAMLYGVEAFDALTFVIALGVLLGVCLLAAFLPARRVAKVDPAIALRM